MTSAPERTLQRRVLYAMLIALGLSAACGVMAVFVSAAEVIGRLAGTGGLTAAAMALAILPARWLDRDGPRKAALFGLAALTLTYCLAFGAMWIDLIGGRVWEELALSALFTGLTGLFATIFLLTLRSPNLRIGSIVGLVFCGVTLAVWLTATWKQWFSGLYDWTDFLYVSGSWTAGLGLLATLSLFGFRSDRRYWRWIGVGAALGALVLALQGVWFMDYHVSTWLVEMVIVAAVVAHANVVLLFPLSRSVLWVALVTIASGIGLGVLLSVLNFQSSAFQDGDPNELVARGAGAAGIVAACGTLAVLVVWRLTRKPSTVALVAITEYSTVEVVCPRCRGRQDAPLGASPCTGCGLILTVNVAEPRCPVCNYTLLDIRGNKCPECGSTLATRGIAIPKAT